MNTAQAIRGVVTFAVLVWVVYLLIRSPRNLPLRAITGLIGCSAVSYAFDAAATLGHKTLFGDPMIFTLVQQVFTVAGAYGLICFFLFTVYENPDAKRRAWRQVPLLLLAISGLTVAALSIPPDLRAIAVEATTSTLRGQDMEVRNIGAFNLAANGYMVYAFVHAFLVARRYAKEGQDRRLCRGMVLTATGLAGMASGAAIFAILNIFTWTGNHDKQPKLIVIIGIVAVFAGIPVFLIGLGYRSAMMRLAALRIWRQHRRAYRELTPLWTTLHAQFPEDALDRVPSSPGRDRFSLRGVNRRYYRRVVECRDGLVRVSPYLAHIRNNGDHHGTTAADLARQLEAALQAHATGTPVDDRAIAIAAPTEQGLDADVDQLVALSRALEPARA